MRGRTWIWIWIKTLKSHVELYMYIYIYLPTPCATDALGIPFALASTELGFLLLLYTALYKNHTVQIRPLIRGATRVGIEHLFQSSISLSLLLSLAYSLILFTICSLSSSYRVYLNRLSSFLIWSQISLIVSSVQFSLGLPTLLFGRFHFLAYFFGMSLYVLRFPLF